MKKLTQFSVNYPVTILMIVFGIVLLGIISYDKLGIDLFPDLNNPRIFVEIMSGDRPPEEIEKQYVEKIEALAIRQKDVLEVSSISRVGSAQITVEYGWNKDMDEAFLDIQKALNTFSQNTEIDEINITQHDPNSSPVILIGLTHEYIEDMNELRKVTENYIRNELIRLEGIADVKLSGYEEKEVIISTSNYSLEAFNLTMADLKQQIQGFNQTLTGGTVNEMGLQYIVKGVSLLENIEDFENIIVGYKSVELIDPQNQTLKSEKAPIFLREVAKVEFANKEPLNIVRMNGKRCVGLSIYKETQYNTVKAVEQVNNALEDIEKALPGYKLTIVSNQGSFITSAIREVKQTALVGILIAVFVLFIFLRRIGTTAIISVAIPISIVATFNLMYFNNLTINIMTLGGLALGAGMLVDNAIIVMENIFRNHESGMNAKEAAITGAAQVGGAITSSTITTIVVFLPIIYLHGASGELFKDEAWTVAFSLISSLLVAIFLIPMLYHQVFKHKKAPPYLKSLKFNAYGSFLERILKYKWVVIVVAFSLIVLSARLVPIIGTEFMPRTDVREFDIEISLPEGTKLERTSSTLSSIEVIVNNLFEEEIESLYSHTGPSSDLSGDDQAIFKGENTGSLKVTLKKDARFTSNQVIAAIDEFIGQIPGMEVNYMQDEMALKNILGTDEAPIVVEVQGDDLEIIDQLTIEVENQMKDIAGIYNLRTSIEEGSPEVEVIIDRLRAGMYQMDINSIVDQISNRLEGEDAGKMENQGELQDITIRLPEEGLSSFMDMTIKNGDQLIRLDEISHIRSSVSPKEIYRRNQSRISKVMADVDKNIPLSRISGTLETSLNEIILPGAYKINIAGEEKKRKQSMQSLTFALLLSIVLVYMVMASQFESLIYPFAILLTIPLAVVGTVLLFYFLNRSFSIMAIIGIIMLVGIAVNDSIILVDRINQLKQEGLDRTLAIITAAKQRIRPIIMTSLTTVLALLPLTIGFGESAALRSPMALAVIGGLVTSTLLTLVVIPCVYDILDQFKSFISGSE